MGEAQSAWPPPLVPLAVGTGPARVPTLGHNAAKSFMAVASGVQRFATASSIVDFKTRWGATMAVRWAVPARFVAFACAALATAWSGEGQAQSEAAAGQAPISRPLPLQPMTAMRPAGPAVLPARPRPVPVVTPAAIPIAYPNTPLGAAIAQECGTATDPIGFTVPGAKGEIKLDPCYRGRGQLSCEFNALTAEAKSLLQDYQSIVGTDYANVSEIGGMCRIQANALSDDLVKIKEFAERFQAFKAENQARSSCAARIEQSLSQVSLSDLPHAPDLLRSIIDSFQGEIQAASALEAQITQLAKQMISSQKAITTIQKVHRAVCTADLPTANEQASR